MRAERFALLAVTALTVAGCGASSGSGRAAATGSVASGGSETAASTGPGAAVAPYGGGYGAAASAPGNAGAAGSLTIAHFRYEPTPLTVAPGELVSVTNTDSADHTATSDIGGLFSADDVKTGKTISFKAPAKPGTYTFHCQFHASMHGTLIVK
ncbi:MAG: hypothetical protein NVS3B26_22200 [Mycobacteriales bacterium]